MESIHPNDIITMDIYTVYILNGCKIKGDPAAAKAEQLILNSEL